MSPAVFAGDDLLSRLAIFGVRPLPKETSLSAQAAYVVSQPTLKLLEAVEAGATLLCLSPEEIFPAAWNRFKPAWWLGSDSDCNAGTVVYPHLALSRIAPEGWADLGWYRLLEGAQAYVLD